MSKGKLKGGEKNNEPKQRGGMEEINLDELNENLLPRN